MMERDDELWKLLRQWETPKPDAKLDTRVWRSIRQSRMPVKKWLPIAAGVLLAAAGVRLFMVKPHVGDGSIRTTMDAAGFRPIANGTITVVKVGEKKQ